MTALRVWWLLRHHENRTSKLPTLLALIAFAVTSAAMLVALGGLHAFDLRRAGARIDGPDPGAMYYVLAIFAVTLMAVPILTLGGLAARLTLARRNQRLALLRLAGATSPQVIAMALAETGTQALVGSLIGALAYGLLLPLVARIPFQGRTFEISELWLGPSGLLLALGLILLLALGSAVVGMTRVVITPLGVANRVSPRSMSFLRVLVGGGLVALWILAGQGTIEASVLMMVCFLGLAVAAINLIGPWLMMVFGHLVVRLASGPAGLLAGRRIVDDPKATWRTTSTLGLAIMLAGMAALSRLDHMSTPDMPHLGADMATGGIVTMVIVSAIAATSTGVVHAARVFDQTPQYRALAYAGTDPQVLHRARILEVTTPMLATVALAGGLVSLILIPVSSLTGLSAVLWFGVAVAGSFALIVAGLLASSPLVERASVIP